MAITVDREGEAIIRDLAAAGAPVAESPSGVCCDLCEAPWRPGNGPLDHSTGCPWRRAVEWVIKRDMGHL